MIRADYGLRRRDVWDARRWDTRRSTAREPVALLRQCKDLTLGTREAMSEC